MQRTVQLIVVLALSIFGIQAQEIQVLDSISQEPIAYATISFGDGLGTFADEAGLFSFSRKKYSDVDSLFISAMGYAEKSVVYHEALQSIYLKPVISQLGEVILSAPKLGKFKNKKQKATTHDDLFSCWLPTVESEVAVFFERDEGRPSQITKLMLPINAETEYRSKGKGKFATIFRIQFYDNKGGLPGEQIGYENVVFAMDEKAEKIFEVDLSSKSIFIPETGIFASLQVLGYANDQGGLAQTKKYREVKTPRGIQKISTSFRPLLPFTRGLPHQNTYVRRIFLNNKKWQVFDQTYNKNSKLIQGGQRNYDMGAEFKVYED